MIKDLLKGVCRRLLSYALGGVSMWLVTHEIISKGEIEWLLLIGSGLLVDLGFAVGARLLHRWRLDVALSLPANTDFERVKAIARVTPLSVKLKEAITGPMVKGKFGE
jgi:hypothetical protein